jgi:peptidase C25-like protein
MKRFLLILSAALAIAALDISAAAQTTYTWNQSVSTDWQIAANWTPARAVLAANDIIVISGTTTPSPTITNIPTQTIGEFLFVNSVLATISTAAANTLTVAGGAATNDFGVSSTSFLIVTGANALTIALGAGAQGAMDGQMTVMGGGHRLTAASVSGLVLHSGAVFTTSTGFSGNAFGTTSLNSVLFASGSQYVHNAGSNPFGAAQPSSVVVFQAGSTAVFRTNTGYAASGRTYANLTADNNTAVSGTGSANFQIQTLTVNSGSSFTHTASGTAQVTITGDITSAGAGNISITSGSGGIVFNSGGSQTIGSGGGTGTITLSALAAGNPITISSGTTLTLARSLNAATGTLTINGTLDQGASFNLTTGAVTIGSGGLFRNLGTGDLTLGGDLTNNSGTVNFNGNGATCGDADDILIRSSVGGTQRSWSGSGTKVFDLVDVDVQDQAGSTPIIVVSGTDSGNNGANWTFRASCAPTAIELVSFTAARFDKGVVLEWQTGFEADNLGFKVYREQSGKRVLVTPQVIAGSALLSGLHTALRAGRSYSFVDATTKGDSNAVYWLEEMDLDGTSKLHGPIIATGKATGKQLSSPSALLADISTQAGQGNTSELLARKAHTVTPSAALLTIQDDLSGRAAAKVTVRQEGWYRITQPDLVAAGIDPNIDPRMLQVFVDGKELPVSVAGETDGRLDPSDAIEFYAVGLDSPSSDARVYWIAVGTRLGQRIKRVQQQADGDARQSFPQTVERRDRTLYFSSLKNGERENFFGPVVSKTPVEQSLTLRHIDTSSTEARLELALQGVTLADHRVRVQINGADAGEVSFYGQSQGTAKLELDRSLLKEGPNVVRLVAEGGDRDISLIDHIRLTYRRSFRADGNLLRFTAAGRQQVIIDGFTTDQVRVFDVTDPDSPQEVAADVSAQGAGYNVTLAAPGEGDRILLAVGADQAKKPAAMAANWASSLRRKSNKADYVIITRRELFGSFKPLRNLRRDQGLAVALVDVDDIYDEFSFGQKTPQAVKDFLAFARSSWKRGPRFVVLGADASFDPKNYFGNGDSDLVPTKLIDTQHMEAASDDWLADFDEDGIAEIAIGRLPVRDAAGAQAMVTRIIAQEAAPAQDSVLLVADNDGDADFDAENSKLRPLVPATVKVEEVRRSQMDPAAAKARLIELINRGQKIVNYSGHGSVNIWRGGLLAPADVSSLSNEGRLPLFMMMTCLNGYFLDPVVDSLAEMLLKAEGGGASAVWASSGMTEPADHGLLNREVFRLIFDAGLTVGEATVKAKASVSDLDVRRTWILFGDPAMKIK